MKWIVPDVKIRDQYVKPLTYSQFFNFCHVSPRHFFNSESYAPNSTPLILEKLLNLDTQNMVWNTIEIFLQDFELSRHSLEATKAGIFYGFKRPIVEKSVEERFWQCQFFLCVVCTWIWRALCYRDPGQAFRYPKYVLNCYNREIWIRFFRCDLQNRLQP